MKQQMLATLSITAAALICGCATKQEAAALRAQQEAADVTAAEERQVQAEVSGEPAIEPAEAEPLPVIEPAPAPAPAPEQPAAQKPIEHPKPVPYKVTEGDSVSALATRFNVRQPDILALNPALRANPDRLSVGQTVLMPPGTDVTVAPKPRKAKPAAPKGATVYTVQSGDVLGGIALTHGVTVASIVEANNLKGDTIFVGQKLTIPGAKQRGRVVAKKDPAAKPAPKPQEAPKAEPPKAEPAPEPAPEAAGEEPLPPPPAVEEGLGADALPPPPAPEAAAATQTYTVQPGEDLVAVSLKWGVTLPVLRAANGLDDAAGNEVAPGTTLKIPVGGAQ